jgi:hypothetical protein
MKKKGGAADGKKKSGKPRREAGKETGKKKFLLPANLPGFLGRGEFERRVAEARKKAAILKGKRLTLNQYTFQGQEMEFFVWEGLTLSLKKDDHGFKLSAVKDLSPQGVTELAIAFLEGEIESFEGRKYLTVNKVKFVT